MEKLPDTSLDLAAVDVTSYISEAQPFILQAIKGMALAPCNTRAHLPVTTSMDVNRWGGGGGGGGGRWGGGGGGGEVGRWGRKTA